MDLYDTAKIIRTYHKNIFHSFDVGVAVLLGLHPAIVFNYLKNRLTHIKSMGCEQYKDRTWLRENVWCSLDYLYYLNIQEFSEALDMLSQHEMILIARDHDFCKIPEDEDSDTIWYALTEEWRLGT